MKKNQLSIFNKYNHEFITEFVEKNFVEASLFDPAIDYSEIQKKELVLEAKTKVILFLNEYQNSCYSCDIERTKKLTAMYLSNTYNSNAYFRGQCFKLMENITNNSDLIRIINPRDFCIDVSKIDNLYINLELLKSGNSLFKTTCELATLISLARNNPNFSYYLTSDQELEKVLDDLNLKSFSLKGKIPQKNSDIIEVDFESKTYCVREVKITYQHAKLDNYRNKVYNLGSISEEKSEFLQLNWKYRMKFKILEELNKPDLSLERKQFFNNLLFDLDQGKIKSYDASIFYINGPIIVSGSDLEN